ncbi:Beta-mannosyltransferase 4 [Candida viswanathii]|uniref:Beta-mannosyltransferase 4 n=1 Tax=Candida viswanathii TaxID=5486 RepID=A0A367YGY0_9ASCO|nr:Beta-mannosyltransferase 4 [Candida viswanathii]
MSTSSYTPLFPPRRLRRAYLLLIPFLLVLVFFHYGYDGFDKLYEYHTLSESLIFRFTNSAIYHLAISNLFPYFTIYPKNYKHKLPMASENQRIVKYSGSPEAVLSSNIISLSYTNQTLSIFSSLQQGGAEDCNSINYHRDLEITDYFVLPDELIKMAQVLKYQLENEAPFRELEPFFEGDKIGRLLMKGHARQHFYKFAGTSVWLKNHGVHLMISRVIFSKYAKKVGQQLSLLYAQIYDENWKELVDVELVLPVVNADGEQVYETTKFPKFLPIPFFHNAKKIKKRWYGPEDTRLLLTKNQHGEDEPVIVFNAYQRQVEKITSTTQGDVKLRTVYKFYRTMFVGWLFRYQKGKDNTDGFHDPKLGDVPYVKIKELRIEGQARLRIEKNWTPFIDPSERSVESGGRDEHFYLVYQWNNLKVLQCELAEFADESQSTCRIVHKEDPNSDLAVGPVRGGTELISLPNSTGRNLWIGFLRAHIKKCGCGGSVYRPNFLVLERIGGVFKLTYLSGSITFNVAVYGFSDFETVCKGREPNALIPNGISMFDAEKDYLTLSLSVADQDNTMLHMHGIRKLVELLDHTWEGGNDKVETRQIVCVVEHAVQTCKDYADEHFRLGDSEAAKKKAEEDRKAQEQAEKEKQEQDKLAKEKEEAEKAEKETLENLEAEDKAHEEGG